MVIILCVSVTAFLSLYPIANITIQYAVALLLGHHRIRLAIHKSLVRVLAGHYCVVALGKCLCHQAVPLGTCQMA